MKGSSTQLSLRIKATGTTARMVSATDSHSTLLGSTRGTFWTMQHSTTLKSTLLADNAIFGLLCSVSENSLIVRSYFFAHPFLCRRARQFSIVF